MIDDDRWVNGSYRLYSTWLAIIFIVAHWDNNNAWFHKDSQSINEQSTNQFLRKDKNIRKTGTLCYYTASVNVRFTRPTSPCSTIWPFTSSSLAGNSPRMFTSSFTICHSCKNLPLWNLSPESAYSRRTGSASFFIEELFKPQVVLSSSCCCTRSFSAVFQGLSSSASRASPTRCWLGDGNSAHWELPIIPSWDDGSIGISRGFSQGSLPALDLLFVDIFPAFESARPRVISCQGTQNFTSPKAAAVMHVRVQGSNHVQTTIAPKSHESWRCSSAAGNVSGSTCHLEENVL